MPHVFEIAPTGRAKCRGCGLTIERGQVRFGERLPNAFGEGEMTLWFHPGCAAYKRPESLLEGLAQAEESPAERGAWEAAARKSLEHRRLPRVDGAERASSGQAKCRHCREKIEKGAWRIRLVFYEEGRFSPGGFLHLACGPAYFEGHDALPAVLHFSSGLEESERQELARAYREAQAAAG